MKGKKQTNIVKMMMMMGTETDQRNKQDKQENKEARVIISHKIEKEERRKNSTNLVCSHIRISGVD